MFLFNDDDEFVLALNDYRFQSWGETMHGGFLYAMGIRSEEDAYKRIVFDSQETLEMKPAEESYDQIC